MLLFCLLCGHASAAVLVDDPGGCISAEGVELEIGAWVRDDLLAKIDLHVRLERSDPWLLDLRATRLGGDELLWWQSLTVEPIDCPRLALVIARVAEQQLAGIPSWRLAAPPRRVRSEVLFELAGTAPQALHFTFGGGVGLPVGRRWLWLAHVDGYLAGPVDLPLDRITGRNTRSAQFVGLLFGTGIAHDLPLGEASVRTRALVAIGPHQAYGHEFPELYRQLIPRATANLQVDLVPSFPLRVGVRLTVPFVRAGVYDEGPPNDTLLVAEPWVRLGLVFGVGAPVASPRRGIDAPG